MHNLFAPVLSASGDVAHCSTPDGDDLPSPKPDLSDYLHVSNLSALPPKYIPQTVLLPPSLYCVFAGLLHQVPLHPTLVTFQFILYPTINMIFKALFYTSEKYLLNIYHVLGAILGPGGMSEQTT